MNANTISVFTKLPLNVVTVLMIAEFLLQLPDDISDVIVKSPTDAVGHLLHSRQALTEL